MKLKPIHTLFAMLLLLTGCEEYYRADLDKMDNLMVVESRISPYAKERYIKLSQTSNFNDNMSASPIKEAQCSIVESNGTAYPGTETSEGYYTFRTFVPESGKSYKLQIKHGGDTYESDFETMPPAARIDSIYAVLAEKTIYFTDAYGKPSSSTDKGFELKIDAPLTDKERFYKFNHESVIQWTYQPPSTIGPPPPPWYGWKVFSDTGDNFNLAAKKQFSGAEKVENHTIVYRSLNNLNYLDSLAQTNQGWIITVEQYGITESSYNFYNNINKQLSASGQLFDPVYAQVTGNIHCVTQPDKVVLGQFDLCSFNRYRYFAKAFNFSVEIMQHQVYTFTEIPPSNYFDDGTIPAFWEKSY